MVATLERELAVLIPAALPRETPPEVIECRPRRRWAPGDAWTLVAYVASVVVACMIGLLLFGTALLVAL